MSNFNLKTIKDNFKKNGIFYTPQELAIYMASFINIEIDNVYDPTCGDGSLLSIFPDKILKYGQDNNEPQLEIAKSRLINFTGYCGDTLTNPAFLDKKFDCIMANPPFSIKWQPNNDDIRFKEAPTIPTANRADFAFILHILFFLKENGIAIVLNFPGILYRDGKEKKLREFLINKNYIERIVAIDGDTFVDTKIPTVLIIFRKNKNNTNVIFENKKDKITYLASYEQIKNNDFDLSVGKYIKKEKKKEIINPILLNNNAMNDFFKRVKKELIFNDLVCEIENIDKSFFAKEIIKICNEHLKY